LKEKHLLRSDCGLWRREELEEGVRKRTRVVESCQTLTVETLSLGSASSDVDHLGQKISVSVDCEDCQESGEVESLRDEDSGLVGRFRDEKRLEFTHHVETLLRSFDNIGRMHDTTSGEVPMVGKLWERKRKKLINNLPPVFSFNIAFSFNTHCVETWTRSDFRVKAPETSKE